MFAAVPDTAETVCVEMYSDPALALPVVQHPERAVYILGAEDSGVPTDVAQRCNHWASIPTCGTFSLNVAVAGSIVMYDRIAKGRS
jgi:tRNA G18 (ribose-2'-O)-methylase SpoU